MAFLIMEPEVLVDTNSVREVMGFTEWAPFQKKVSANYKLASGEMCVLSI